MDGTLTLVTDAPDSEYVDPAAPRLVGEGDAGPAPVTPPQIIEALLLATDTPLPAARIAHILGVGDARDVRRHIAALNERYEAAGASFRVEEIAGGFQILTMPVYNNWLAKLLRVRQESRLSPAAMETLAVVAYKQPVARADIESVRGVACGDVLNRLRELNLVKIVGRAEDVGRPLLYGTTKRFLEVFGLASLDDLPKVEALRDGMKGAGNTAPHVVPAESAASPETPPPEANAGEGAAPDSISG